jgi:hypothetical protein
MKAARLELYATALRVELLETHASAPQVVPPRTFGTGILTDSEGAGGLARVPVNFEDAGSR